MRSPVSLPTRTPFLLFFVTSILPKVTGFDACSERWWVSSPLHHGKTTMRALTSKGNQSPRRRGTATTTSTLLGAVHDDSETAGSLGELPRTEVSSRTPTSTSTSMSTSTSTRTTSSSTTRTTLRRVLDFMKDSSLIQAKHAEHRSSPSVTHLFKGTWFAAMPDEWKLRFVDSWAGRAVETVMAEEQASLGEWKRIQIVDAAGPYNASWVRARIAEETASHPIVVYSFVDCPWCVATKELLARLYPNSHNSHSHNKYQWIELEPLGWEGKHIRAELAQLTGRTSLPCVFVHQTPVGGYTDGDPCGPGLKALYDSGRLLEMVPATEETDSPL